MYKSVIYIYVQICFYVFVYLLIYLFLRFFGMVRDEQFALDADWVSYRKERMSTSSPLSMAHTRPLDIGQRVFHSRTVARDDDNGGFGGGGGGELTMNPPPPPPVSPPPPLQQWEAAWAGWGGD